MDNQENKQLLGKLIGHFGVERLIAALPQDEVRLVLDLVSMQDVAKMLDMNYSTLHWHMTEGHIPYPQIRLVRRAYFTRQEAEGIVREWKQKNRSWK